MAKITLSIKYLIEGRMEGSVTFHHSPAQFATRDTTASSRGLWVTEIFQRSLHALSTEFFSQDNDELTQPITRYIALVWHVCSLQFLTMRTGQSSFPLPKRDSQAVDSPCSVSQ